METATVDSDSCPSVNNSSETRSFVRNESVPSASEGRSFLNSPAAADSSRILTPMNCFANPSKNINCMLIGELVEAARCIVRNSAVIVKGEETPGEKWEIRIPSATSVITVHFRNKNESIISEIQERSAHERQNASVNEIPVTNVTPPVNVTPDVSVTPTIERQSTPIYPEKINLQKDFGLKECYVKLDRLSVESMKRGGRENNSTNDSFHSLPPLIKHIKTEIIDDYESSEVTMDTHSEVQESSQVSVIGTTQNEGMAIPATAPILHPEVKIKKEVEDVEDGSCCSAEMDLQKSTGGASYAGQICMKCHRFSETGGVCTKCQNEKDSLYRNRPEVSGTYVAGVARPNVDKPSVIDSQGSKQVHTIEVLPDADVKGTSIPYLNNPQFTVIAPETPVPTIMQDDTAMDTMSSMNMNEEQKMAQNIDNANTSFGNNFQGKITSSFSLADNKFAIPSSFSNAPVGKTWDPNLRSWECQPEGSIQQMNNYNEREGINIIPSYSPYIQNENQQRIDYQNRSVNACSMSADLQEKKASQLSNGNMFFDKMNPVVKNQFPHQFEPPHLNPTTSMSNIGPIIPNYQPPTKTDIPSSCALSKQPFDVDVKPFVCEICKEVFPTQQHLKDHHQLIHMRENLYNTS